MNRMIFRKDLVKSRVKIITYTRWYQHYISNLISWPLYTVQSHWLLLLLFPVANDVRHAILSDHNFTAVNPLTQNISSTFILAGILTHGVELLFKILNTITLFFDLAIIFLIDRIHNLLHLELILHLYLCSSSLAPRFQNMHTSSLGCCQDKNDTMTDVQYFYHWMYTYCWY